MNEALPKKIIIGLKHYNVLGWGYTHKKVKNVRKKKIDKNSIEIIQTPEGWTEPGVIYKPFIIKWPLQKCHLIKYEFIF